MRSPGGSGASARGWVLLAVGILVGACVLWTWRRRSRTAPVAAAPAVQDVRDVLPPRRTEHVALDAPTDPGLRLPVPAGTGAVTDPGLRRPVPVEAGASDVTDPGLRRPESLPVDPAAAAVQVGVLVGSGPPQFAVPAGHQPPPAPYAPGGPPYPPMGQWSAPVVGRPPYPPPAGFPLAGPPAAPMRAPRAAPPGPPHRWGLGAYVIAEAVFLAVSALFGLLMAGGTVDTAMLAAALAVPTVLAAATAVLITVLRGNGPWIDLGLQASWRDVGLGLAFGFGGLFLTIPASAVYVTIVGDDASSAVGDIFGGATAGPLVAVLVLVIVVLVAPMCEEILYRGLLWGGVTRLGANRWVAFGVTTIVFALFHFEFTRAPLLIIVSLPIGLARVYTGRLVASVVAHQVNNLLPGIGLMLMLLGALPAM